MALLEANDYPFWASQFHPEKNAFEWTQKWNNIPHSKEAIETATFFAEYFVEKTRKNHNNFETRNAEEQYLIYNFSPIYTGRQAIDSTMEQSYIFWSFYIAQHYKQESRNLSQLRRAFSVV